MKNLFSNSDYKYPQQIGRAVRVLQLVVDSAIFSCVPGFGKFCSFEWDTTHLVFHSWIDRFCDVKACDCDE